jgi:hypothetical protein
MFSIENGRGMIQHLVTPLLQQIPQARRLHET